MGLKLARKAMPVSVLLKKCLIAALVELDVTLIIALCGPVLLEDTDAMMTLNAAAVHVVPMGLAKQCSSQQCSLPRWNLHLQLAPSVTIKRLPGRLKTTLIAQPIRFAWTKSATRMQSGQKRGIVALVATMQATGTLEMCAVMKSPK